MKKLLLFLFVWFLLHPATGQTVPEQMQAYCRQAAAAGILNGTVLVAQGNKVVFQQGYGWKDAARKIPNDESTIYQLGSITKQFTSTVVLWLQENHKLALSDKLSKYYPGYPNGDKVTIEQLLSHTSGIYNYTQNDSFMAKGAMRPATEKMILSLFRDKPLDFEPGTSWKYSNSGYSLLGYIIQKITGEPYEQVVRRVIFRPVGMRHSGFDFAGLKDSNRAVGYRTLAGDHGMRAGLVDSTVSFSAGAMYSTVGDLHRWDESLLHSRILSPASLRNIFTVRRNKYGLGWSIDSIYGKRVISHGGGIFGFVSFNAWIPSDSLSIIVLCNANNSRPGKVAHDLYSIWSGKSYTTPRVHQEIKLEESVLRPYVGEYELRPGVMITITLEGGGLKVQVTGQRKADLYAEKENYFFLRVVDAQIEFVRDASGRVEKLILHQNGKDLPAKKIK